MLRPPTPVGLTGTPRTNTPVAVAGKGGPRARCQQDFRRWRVRVRIREERKKAGTLPPRPGPPSRRSISR